MLLEPITILQSSATLADPHVCSDDKDRLSIVAAVYEPLVRRLPGGAFAPCLATEWNLTPDACTWRFTLRNHVRFHNGDPFEAGDVVASLERICDPSMGGELGTQGVYRSYLGGAQFTALGPHHLQITTQEPLADMLDILAELPVAPRRALNNSLQTRPIGSGPFTVIGHTDRSVEMTAFDAYWGAAPSARRVRWLAVPDRSARITALVRGEADLVSGVAGAAVSQVTDAPHYRVVRYNGSTCVILMCRIDAGPCADERVRQAINYAVDVDALIAELHNGAAAPLAGPLTADHFGVDPTIAPYPYDPARARELLAAAGFGDGLALILDAPTTLPDESPLLAERIQADLAEAGIRLQVRLHDNRPAYADMVRAKRIGDLCVFDSSPLSSFRVLREKFHSGRAGPWWLGYTNADVDRRIDRAQATVDVAERRRLYQQVFAAIHADAPWIFLYSPQLAWGVGPRLQGWQASSDGLVRLG
jgi:peptide/nickel transport system substrate-binding protein